MSVSSTVKAIKERWKTVRRHQGALIKNLILREKSEAREGSQIE